MVALFQGLSQAHNYSLFQKEISNIPTFTPSLFNQTRRITRHNVSVTRYKSVMKNGHDWSPVSTVCLRMSMFVSIYMTLGIADYNAFK